MHGRRCWWQQASRSWVLSGFSLFSSWRYFTWPWCEMRAVQHSQWLWPSPDLIVFSVSGDLFSACVQHWNPDSGNNNKMAAMGDQANHKMAATTDRLSIKCKGFRLYTALIVTFQAAALSNGIPFNWQSQSSQWEKSPTFSKHLTGTRKSVGECHDIHIVGLWSIWFRNFETPSIPGFRFKLLQ